MRRLSKLGIRRKPTISQQDLNTYQQQHEQDVQKQNTLQSELWRLEQERYKRIEEEEHQRAVELQREKDELYKQQQLSLQLQEAENRRQEQLRKTTPEALLRMQDLIRTRHELDLEIWRDRHVNKENRDVLMQKGMRADEILQEIYSIVDIWEESGWDPEEWKVARKIKQNIQDGNQRIWASNPPWNDRDS